MNRKVVVFLISLAALAVLALPISAQQETTLRFTVWVGIDHPIMEEVFIPLAEEYEAQNEGVTIEYVSIPFSEYELTLVTQLSSENPPDAGWIVERSGATFINANALLDLTPYIIDDEEYDFADYSEPALATWMVDDAIYGIPFSTSPYLSIYNATLFEEAGIPTPIEMYENGEWTWENLFDAAATIQAETDAWGFFGNDGRLYTPDAWGTLVPLMRAYGTDIFNADNECTMNSPEAIEAYTALHEAIFVDEIVAPPGTEASFFAGDAGITLGQLSRLTNLDDADFEWGIAPLPAGPAGEVPVLGQAAINAFDTNNNDNQDLAADFVKFLTTRDSVVTMLTFFPPARLSVLEDPVFLESNPRVDAESMEQVIASAIGSGSPLLGHPNFPEIELTGGAVLDLLWLSGADVAGTLDIYCQTISPLLETE